jgi:predicted RNase H-like nuclease (RuvC/YqgF family)
MKNLLRFFGAIFAGIIVTLISSLLLDNWEENRLQNRLAVIKEQSSRLEAQINAQRQEILTYEQKIIEKEVILAEAIRNKPWHQLGDSPEMRVLKREIEELKQGIKERHQHIDQLNNQLTRLAETQVDRSGVWFWALTVGAGLLLISLLLLLVLG